MISGRLLLLLFLCADGVFAEVGAGPIPPPTTSDTNTSSNSGVAEENVKLLAAVFDQAARTLPDQAFADTLASYAEFIRTPTFLHLVTTTPTIATVASSPTVTSALASTMHAWRRLESESVPGQPNVVTMTKCLLDRLTAAKQTVRETLGDSINRTSSEGMYQQLRHTFELVTSTAREMESCLPPPKDSQNANATDILAGDDKDGAMTVDQLLRRAAVAMTRSTGANTGMHAGRPSAPNFPGRRNHKDEEHSRRLKNRRVHASLVSKTAGKLKQFDADAVDRFEALESKGSKTAILIFVLMFAIISLFYYGLGYAHWGKSTQGIAQISTLQTFVWVARYWIEAIEYTSVFLVFTGTRIYESMEFAAMAHRFQCRFRTMRTVNDHRDAWMRFGGTQSFTSWLHSERRGVEPVLYTHTAVNDKSIHRVEQREHALALLQLETSEPPPHGNEAAADETLQNGDKHSVVQLLDATVSEPSQSLYDTSELDLTDSDFEDSGVEGGTWRQSCRHRVCAYEGQDQTLEPVGPWDGDQVDNILLYDAVHLRSGMIDVELVSYNDWMTEDEPHKPFQRATMADNDADTDFLQALIKNFLICETDLSVKHLAHEVHAYTGAEIRANKAGELDELLKSVYLMRKAQALLLVGKHQIAKGLSEDDPIYALIEKNSHVIHSIINRNYVNLHENLLPMWLKMKYYLEEVERMEKVEELMETVENISSFLIISFFLIRFVFEFLDLEGECKALIHDSDARPLGYPGDKSEDFQIRVGFRDEKHWKLSPLAHSRTWECTHDLRHVGGHHASANIQFWSQKEAERLYKSGRGDQIANIQTQSTAESQLEGGGETWGKKLGFTMIAHGNVERGTICVLGCEPGYESIYGVTLCDDLGGGGMMWSHLNAGIKWHGKGNINEPACCIADKFASQLLLADHVTSDTPTYFEVDDSSHVANFHWKAGVGRACRAGLLSPAGMPAGVTGFVLQVCDSADESTCTAEADLALLDVLSNAAHASAAHHDDHGDDPHHATSSLLQQQQQSQQPQEEQHTNSDNVLMPSSSVFVQGGGETGGDHGQTNTTLDPTVHHPIVTTAHTMSRLVEVTFPGDVDIRDIPEPNYGRYFFNAEASGGHLELESFIPTIGRLVAYGANGPVAGYWQKPANTTAADSGSHSAESDPH